MICRIDTVFVQMYFWCMIRTQILLPDELYNKAKQFASDREISLAELTRLSQLEYLWTGKLLEVNNSISKVCPTFGFLFLQ